MPPVIYHRWPRSYGGWQAGSVIQCEGDGCRWCEARWKIVKIWDHAASTAETDSSLPSAVTTPPAQST